MRDLAEIPQSRLTQTQMATALAINIAKVSLIERGLAHDNECVRTYHQMAVSADFTP